VFLADFGLGHAITNTQGAGTDTMMAGTPGFQAPEQLKGEGIGIKCDVYALGEVMTDRVVWKTNPFGSIHPFIRLSTR